MAWAPVTAAAFAAGTASSMSHCLLRRTCSAAGAATGMAQGLWRFLIMRTDAAPTASVGLAAVLEPPPAQAPRQLLNVVLVGEPSAGKSSLARAFAGNACVAGVGAGGADLLVMESVSPPATVCLWQGGAAELDPRFYALADAFMVLYDPSVSPQTRTDRQQMGQ